MTYCPKNAQAFNSRSISDEHAADWCRRVYRPGLAQCEGCDLFPGVAGKVEAGAERKKPEQGRLF